MDRGAQQRGLRIALDLDWQSVIGAVLLSLALLLSLPGIRIARADTPSQAAAPGQCTQPPADRRAQPPAGPAPARWPIQLEARPDAADFVVLNSRGYNYDARHRAADAERLRALVKSRSEAEAGR